MKQFATLILTTLLFSPSFALAAGLATMSFTQTTASIEVGETTDLTILVNPNGEALDTVRAVFTFDPTILKVESVARVGAFDRNTPGNFIDNKNGKVSWGGFTLSGSVKTESQFVKVTMSARQEGSTKIQLTDESKLISDGEEKINGKKLNEVDVTVASARQSDSGLSLITVNSSTHPEETGWYANDKVEVDWVELAGNSKINAYYYAFDQASNTDPSIYSAPTQTNKTFDGTQDGIHYFHIKGVEQGGKTTKTIHRRIQIDTQKPNPVAITLSEDQLIEGESLWMTFATTDDLSGVEQYKLSINTSKFRKEDSPLELTDLVPGTYFLRVSAVDRAGNTSTQGQSVRVYPAGTELQRPENYDPNSEIKTLTDESSPLSPKSLVLSPLPTKLLITLALLLATTFGIIYAIKNKKTK